MGTLQFAWLILGISYLSIQADLAFALVDNVVELDWNSNFVNCIISYFALVWEIIIVEVTLSDPDRVVWFRVELAVGNVQSATCPPDGARTPAMVKGPNMARGGWIAYLKILQTH